MEAVILAVDDGHYGIKVTGQSGNYLLNALVAEGRHPRIDSATGLAKEDELYVCDGHEYTMLEDEAKNAGNKPIVSTSTPNYLLSPANAVMVHHSIRRSGYSGKPVVLCTTLPFSRFYTGEGINAALIEKKKQNLANRVVTSFGYTPFTISEQYVLSEGVAAYFDLLYNQDLSINENVAQIAKSSLITIVDIGGQTTDIVTLNNGQIELSKSITKTGDYVGGLYLKKQVRNTLAKEMNCLEENIQDSLIENVIANCDKQLTDTDKKISGYKNQMASYIANAVSDKVGGAHDVGLVLFVGGGSLLLQKHLLELFPNKSRLATNPVFANAQGMYKLMQLKMQGLS